MSFRPGLATLPPAGIVVKMTGADQPFRFGTGNPFTGAADNNPFTSLTTLKLVEVPAAPETHERRTMRRTYLSTNGGGGMDDLLSALTGRRPKKIEVTRTVQAPADDAEAPAAMPPRAGPPVYGKRP